MGNYQPNATINIFSLVGPIVCLLNLSSCTFTYTHIHIYGHTPSQKIASKL